MNKFLLLVVLFILAPGCMNKELVRENDIIREQYRTLQRENNRAEYERKKYLTRVKTLCSLLKVSIFYGEEKEWKGTPVNNDNKGAWQVMFDEYCGVNEKSRR